MEISTEGTFTLTKAEAVALATYASSDTTRLTLAGVWLEPELLRAWATDGHRAVMARQIGGHYIGRSPAVYIPRETLEDTARMCRGRDMVRIFTGAPHGAEDGGARTLGAGRVIGLQVVTPASPRTGPERVRASTHCTPPADLTAPSIDVVMHVPTRPERPSTPYFGINAQYMADVLLLARAAETEAVEVVPPGDPLSPTGYRTTHVASATEWLACIMPTRMEPRPRVHFDPQHAVDWAAEQVRAQHGHDAANGLREAFATLRELPATGKGKVRQLKAV